MEEQGPTQPEPVEPMPLVPVEVPLDVKETAAKSLGILEKKQLVKVIEDRYELIAREVEIQAERIRNQILEEAESMNSGNAARITDEVLTVIAKYNENNDDLSEITSGIRETYAHRLQVLREELRSLESEQSAEVSTHERQVDALNEILKEEFSNLKEEMDANNLDFEGYGIHSLRDAHRQPVEKLVVKYERGGTNVRQKMRELGVDEGLMKHELKKQMQSKIEVVALGGIDSDTKAALLADIPDPMDALPSQARVKEIAAQL